MATQITDAQRELISLLAPDDIPIKLRCAICSKLAINAFRLPCCEQAICENCHATLPSSCPVCEHSPLSADDCKQHKSLRTTIRVFLRTEEKKRESSRPKEPRETAALHAESNSATPAEVKVEDPTLPSRDASQDGAQQAVSLPDKDQDVSVTTSPVLDTTHQDVEENLLPQDGSDSAPGTQSMVQTEAEGQVEEGTGPEISDETNDALVNGGAVEQRFNEMNGNYGFGPMNGQHQGMGMNGSAGDLNQMQMMMTMQGGMPQGAFNGFPMMGMPGMGMDPMAMQNMYMNMNGGFSQGMGMNDMSAGMGFGNGMGANENWNGQQAWGFGQDNFVHANTPGMGSGDFGSYSSGYQTGFNQGSFGHQFNDYRRNNYPYRGRGRGRGFYDNYGRGRFHGFSGNQNHWSGGPSQHPHNQAMVGQESTSGANVGDMVTNGSTDEVMNPDQPAESAIESTGPRVVAAPDQCEASQEELDSHSREPINSISTASQFQVTSDEGPLRDPADARSAEIGTAVSMDTSSRPSGLNGRAPSSGENVPIPSISNPDVPLNAPTGPKAMRQGLPNTSLHILRARGFHGNRPLQASNHGEYRDSEEPAAQDRPHSRSSSSLVPRNQDLNSVHARDRSGEQATAKDPHQERGVHDREPGGSLSPSPSRNRSRDHKRLPHGMGHNGSEPPSDDEFDDRDDRDQVSRRRKSRREYTPHEADEVPISHAKDQRSRDRTRSISPEEGNRSSRRRRRDRDSDKRRDRDAKDHDDDYDQRHKSSSHRERDRDRGRDRDRPHDKTREKSRDRNGDRDREKDKGRDRDYHRDRVRDRDRDRNKERNRGRERGKDRETDSDRAKSTKDRGRDRHREDRHRSGKHPNESSLPLETTIQEDGNSRGARNEPKSLHTKSLHRHETTSSTTSGTKDTHTTEREARDRERLLKEAQRIAGLASLAGVKRSRTDIDDGRRGRRKSRRSEVVVADDGEERMRRLEAEREADRWA